MHISKKLREAETAGKPSFSFEYFPPRTSQGTQNLYDRIDRMHDLGPSFIDITWGAGGSRSALTLDLVKAAQSAFGLETCMHLTCTDMSSQEVHEALQNAYKTGCTNILALRGDPPRDTEEWQQADGGFSYAKDLIKFIKKQYGEHFSIGVAGYPEGAPDNRDVDELIDHLKEKVDAGGAFIVTQMVYDADHFIDWMRKVRAKGITVPILPGIMPVSSHASFLRRSAFMDCKIPQSWSDALDPIKNDDAAVQVVGNKLVAEFCQRLLDAGVNHLHFYTMNLAKGTRQVLEYLDMLPKESEKEKPLPWRPSLGLNRREENVRPIFWRNRNRSYVERTQDWDSFPNGRWGDSRSPAFGEIDAYDIGLRGTNEANRKLWGEPKSLREMTDIFVRYMEGKLESLPWSEAEIQGESSVLRDNLINLNSRGIFTINSQPPVNGASSTDSVLGWGPKNGYVYQKAYLEVLVSPEIYSELIARVEKDPHITYYAVNRAGDLSTNSVNDGPNAVTWGVFPGKEIVQPTIVETTSFMAWKDEFYRLGRDWSHCHESSSPTRRLLESIMGSFYLVNIVHNDFKNDNGIFPLFSGLELSNLDSDFNAKVNGVH